MSEFETGSHKVSKIDDIPELGAEQRVCRADRPSVDEYLMGIAVAAATRSTCPKRRVGSVVAVRGRLLGAGYNGAPSGLRHCDEVGCENDNGKCARTIHAEVNAVLSALRGGDLLDAVLYTTVFPCYSCFKVVAAVGIKHIMYLEHRDDRQVVTAALALGIRLTKL